MNRSSIRSRCPQLIVAPLITFLGVGVLLLIARFIERMPVQPPRCAFKSMTDIPCVGCGGTRAMMALSRGEFVTALQFNPAIILSVVAIVIWLLLRLSRFLRRAPAPPRTFTKRKTVILITIFGIVFFSNWIYLILFLP